MVDERSIECADAKPCNTPRPYYVYNLYNSDSVEQKKEQKSLEEVKVKKERALKINMRYDPATAIVEAGPTTTTTSQPP